MLTQGQLALVDDDDFEQLNAHKWYAWWNPHTQSFYAERNDYSSGKKRTILMHRQIVGAVFGSVVDHINHDTIDNQRCNLRVCLSGENQRNTRKQRNGKSLFKGVSRHSLTEKWRARIHVNGREIALGLFDSPESAAKAYDAAARLHFGEFALTNENLGLVSSND